jgi:hypothetical protein
MPRPIQPDSTLAPPLRPPRFTTDELHVLTAIPMFLLEGYARGLFKPAKPEARELTRIAVRCYKESAFMVALRVDRARFTILRKILPFEESQKLKDCKPGEPYHVRLLELVNENRERFDAELADRHRKDYGYDADSRR